MTVETLTTFLFVSGLLALAPGPDNLFVLTQSALYGRFAGLCVTFGLCTGLLVHTFAVVLGVVAIFQHPAAYLGLKIIGAVYLLAIAWQTFRANPQNVDHNKVNPLSAMTLYRRGIIMNITNPKVAIFFLAFLPQFASPRFGALGLQLIQLGALFMLMTLLVFSLIAILAGALGTWLKTHALAQRTMNYLVAIVLCGLAIRLLFTR